MQLLVLLAIIAIVVVSMNIHNEKMVKALQKIAERTGGEFKKKKITNRFEKIYLKIFSDSSNYHVEFSHNGRPCEIRIHDNYAGSKGSVSSIEVSCYIKRAFGMLSIEKGRIVKSDDVKTDISDLEHLIKSPDFEKPYKELIGKYRFNQYQANGPRGDFIVEGERVFVYRTRLFLDSRVEWLLGMVDDLCQLTSLFEAYL